jgi:hypothetical protein
VPLNQRALAPEGSFEAYLYLNLAFLSTLFSLPKTTRKFGRASQTAEKLPWRSGLYQGTSLLVPQKPQNQRRASAPANFAQQQMTFSATSSVGLPSKCLINFLRG